MSRLEKMKNQQNKQDTLKDKLAKAPNLNNSIPKLETTIPNNEQVKQRQDIKTFASQAGQAESPFDFDIKTALKKSIIADIQSPELTKAKKDIENEYKQALSEYKQDKDAAKWGRIAESLGQALTQLGAGAYGLKHGVDLSGIKFDKADWKSNIDSAMQELKMAREKRDEQLKGRSLGESRVLQRLAQLRQLEKEDIKPEDKISELDKEKLALEREKLGLKKRELEQKRIEKSKKISAGAEKAQREWEQSGKAAYLADKDRIESAISSLEKEDVKAGGIWGMAPKGARLAFASVIDSLGGEKLSKDIEEGVSAELDIAAVTAKSLRETLGGQFAQEEGKNIMKNMFHPGLSKEQLITNAKRIQTRLDRAAEAKSKGLSEKELKAAFQGNDPIGVKSEQEREFDKVRTKIQERKAKGKEPESYSAARKWLKANPNHPKAKAVREKLEGN